MSSPPSRAARRRTPRRTAPGLAALAAGVIAVVVALGADAGHVLATPEQDSVALRFRIRGEQPVTDVAVVAIDDVSFSDLGRSWPFPRSLHARAIDRLRKAGARAIVYDVQFTEPTRPREDAALYDAVARAPGTILATTETDGHGATRILGGSQNLADARAEAGAANLITEPGGVVQRFPFSVGGLPTLAVVAARHAGGAHLDPGRFPHGGAWIDFRGPPHTIPTVSFSDLVRGRADLSLLRGRIVVVGAEAPTLQDVHATAASNHNLMSGPEVQANAIWTALHGLPLRSAPAWVGWLAILIGGLAPALATLRGRAMRAALVAPVLGAAWLLAVQAGFASGLILPLSYPLVALVLGTVSAMTAAFVLEREAGRQSARYAARLVEAVAERTEELRQTQLEIVSRLGRAIEWRDADTGVHVDRMSTLSHRVALALGMPAGEAELLRHAAGLHDIGKLGIPDRVLRKPGRLDDDERAVMQTHAAIGGEILAGSRSALVVLAETIARAHHERWDGSGYPAGLSGEAIPLPARICALCDVVDALLSERTYKPPWPLADVLAEIVAQRGRHFDPQLVDVFLALVPTLEPELLNAAAVPAARLGQLTLGAPATATPAAAAPVRGARG